MEQFPESSDDSIISQIATPYRRNSYQMAIHAPQHRNITRISNYRNHISSLSKKLNETTSHSLYFIDSEMFMPNGSIEQLPSRGILKPSYSEPIDTFSYNDLLLENTSEFLDSPLHVLRSSNRCLSTHDNDNENEKEKENENENENKSSSINDVNLIKSTKTKSTYYRLVIMRSIASTLALSGLMCTEILQTTIYSSKTGVYSLVSFHLSIVISSILISYHIHYIKLKSLTFTISKTIYYDRCSQISIILCTCFTGVWIIINYQTNFNLLLIGAIISGFSVSLMKIQTYENLLQWCASMTIDECQKIIRPNSSTTDIYNNWLKIRTSTLMTFVFIYHILCQLALIIGCIMLFVVITFQEWRKHYILVAYYPCLIIKCITTGETLTSTLNMTIYKNDKQQEWQLEPERYIFFLSLLIFTLLSLLPQAIVEWSSLQTAFKNENRIENNQNLQYYRRAHILVYILLFYIGLQEAYVYGSMTKFSVSCLYGIKHLIETLILYGISLTISSILFAVLLKRLGRTIVILLVTLLHSVIFVLLYFWREEQENFLFISPVLVQYILFFCYGIVNGIWSMIAFDYLCNPYENHSASTLGQSIAVNSCGRIVMYLCQLFICQRWILYLNILILFVTSILSFLCNYCKRNSK
ncbi:unnamed protein product [Didymodactylos carnosus]|uniref:Uncharacterized protein n=1 Tax=Didymodactylos carnosus TaxID=1234261 RepID=A0A813W2U2_9BILA|nr:unnamed protein product [Didymodactylos carnosus]CAF0851608.1 unnamed protein product [Didymodactylos carnosus]CAF3596841.1 unnamed protein product [Didymodactylos carnosus]CAF3639218.1 unnamed protein product [Didymodactylos carnosus]